MSRQKKLIKILIILILIYLFFGVGFLYAGGWRRPKATFYIQKGDEFLLKQNYEAAFWEYQKALFFTPRNPTVYFNLGKIYEKKNQVDKAIENYLKAKKYAPNELKILSALGKMYFKKKDYSQAKIQFAEIQSYQNFNEEEVRSLYFSSLIYLARIYLIEGNLIEAEANLGLVLTREPENKLAQYYDLILLLMKHPELVVSSKATSIKSIKVDVLRKAAEQLIKIKNPLTKKVILGVAFNQVGELDLANRLLNEVIAKEKNYRDAWLYLGENYYLQKNYSEATKCLDKALELDPISSRAKKLKKLIEKKLTDI